MHTVNVSYYYVLLISYCLSASSSIYQSIDSLPINLLSTYHSTLQKLSKTGKNYGLIKFHVKVLI